MAVDNFIYQGINRAISDYSGSRMCEELINLRPTTEGLVPVKDFDAKFTNVAWRRVFVHHTTTGDNYIVIRVVGDGDDAAVQHVDEDGSVIQTLFLTEWNGDQTLESLHFASAGNILLLSLCDKDNSVYENRAFVWKDGGYEAMEAEDPGVTYSITSETVAMVKQEVPYQTEPYDSVQLREYLDNALNAVQEGDPAICLGPVVIATALKTKDGSTFWTGDWMVYDPVAKINADGQTYADGNTPGFPAFFDDFFDEYGHGYFVGVHNDGPSRDRIYVEGTKVTLTFPSIIGWNEESSIIQSVEVYASRPQIYLDTASAYDGYDTQTRILVIPQKDYADMELDSQLLYHQASIPMSSLAEDQQSVTLTFGGNTQITEDTLDTDAGALKRYGRVLSYNARFHFYDSVSQIKVGNASFNFPSGGTTGTVYVLGKYADEEGEHLLCLGTVPSFPYAATVENAAYLVIAPSINIKEIIVYYKVTGGGYYTQNYRMFPSSTYNYSICTEGAYSTTHVLSGTNTEYDAAITAAGNNNYGAITKYETDTINVTEQYNPFVFRVEHSYKAPGNIIDVQPQMAGITDASYGRDPLNVFTERGLYALTQGSANVLYGAFLPVSNLVGQRGGIPVEMGTFFLADGSLWLVSGRRVTLISDALSEGPHKYIRACPGFKKLSGTDTSFSPTPVVASPVYDVSPYLSKVDFNTFTRGGKLGYNRFRMELFISNPSYDYTYVLSLKYRQWFKLSRRLWQDEPGGVIINRPGTASGTITVLDMANETAGTILAHMQSRPFSMGYQYAHIHRIVAMMRAKLSGTAGQAVAVGLYGSDNLQDWKLLAYAKRAGSTSSSTVNNQTVTTDVPLFLSQVRTPSSARSWRYYTVCIGGNIQAGGDFPTDIGPVLVDYKPVIRRIG